MSSKYFFIYLFNFYLKIVDILLQKAISMDLKPAVMDTLLCHFSPIYRIHRKFIFKILSLISSYILELSVLEKS